MLKLPATADLYAPGASTRRRRRARGMTLIEILVVLGLLALMAAGVIFSMGASRAARVTRATNQLAATMRFAYDKSRVTGMYYRLEVDFEERSFSLQAADEAMYMPATNRDGTIREIDADEEESRADRDKRAAESYYAQVQSKILDTNSDGTVNDPYAVRMEDVPRRRPPLFESFDGANTLKGIGESIVFDERVEIVSVRTEHDLQPITEGKAYVYFFPGGRTQMTHVQLRDKNGGTEFTIVLQPLTGRVAIKPGLEELVLPDEILDGEDKLGRTRERRSF